MTTAEAAAAAMTANMTSSKYRRKSTATLLYGLIFFTLIWTKGMFPLVISCYH